MKVLTFVACVFAIFCGSVLCHTAEPLGGSDTTGNSSLIPSYPSPQNMDEFCTTTCHCKYADIEEYLKMKDGKSALFISAYYESPDGSWDGSGIIPAVEMALDDINAREDILPEYELRAIWEETKVRK